MTKSFAVETSEEIENSTPTSGNFPHVVGTEIPGRNPVCPYIVLDVECCLPR